MDLTDKTTKLALDARFDTVSLPWSDDWAERHALQFFCVHSAPQLAGYFDSPFWQRMVLQAGRHEPAIKHAIAAVGAMHERLLVGSPAPGDGPDQRTKFALEQCNKSIRYLVRDTNEGRKPNTKLMLTACVLFTCFEAMQDRWQEAIAHATQGYHLLQQYSHRYSSQGSEEAQAAFSVEIDQLRAILMRIHVRSNVLVNNDYHITLDPEETHFAQPKRFETLQDARLSLEVVMNALTVLFLDLDLDDQLYEIAAFHANINDGFKPWLEAWEVAFSALLRRTNETASTIDRRAAMVLKANGLVAHIFCNIDLSAGEAGWDAFSMQFSAIVDLAEDVLQSRSEQQRSRSGRLGRGNTPFISATNAEHAFSLGIIIPLCEVCARCRDSTIRDRALVLLSNTSRKECMWSSWSMWKVDKYLFGLEGKGQGRSTDDVVDVHTEKQTERVQTEFSSTSTMEDRALKIRQVRSGRKVRRELNPGLFARDANDEGVGEAAGSSTAPFEMEI